VSIPEGKRGGAITTYSFLKYIGWRAAKPVIVDAHWNDAQGLLEAVLPEEHLASQQHTDDAAVDGGLKASSKRRRVRFI
jgi:hypothetical protein